ncbi:hypothetical protein BpHYR1_049080 [Brachionus plicatilis]|uniref:Uncharacterized protein n=1 Tax=Brachionus plicatilis TaxID=10195 RepID=A0A3M7Q2X4_BRAPC|nr:hypothetical protein BpHYR1_049080 [Brachionus plicatilis]
MILAFVQETHQLQNRFDSIRLLVLDRMEFPVDELDESHQFVLMKQSAVQFEVMFLHLLHQKNRIFRFLQVEKALFGLNVKKTSKGYLAISDVSSIKIYYYEKLPKKFKKSQKMSNFSKKISI